MQIGEIVAALMERDRLTKEAVAMKVRACGAPNVKYQHIQQLLEYPSRRPRYLPELAAAFDMSVEQFLAYKPGLQSSTNQGLQNASQPLRIDAEILAAAVRLVRLACDNLELTFDPETSTDAQLIALGYAYLAGRREHAVTADNVVDFTKRLRERIRGQDVGERRESAESAGGRARKQG